MRHRTLCGIPYPFALAALQRVLEQNVDDSLVNGIRDSIEAVERELAELKEKDQ